MSAAVAVDDPAVPNEPAPPAAGPNEPTDSEPGAGPNEPADDPAEPHAPAV